MTDNSNILDFRTRQPAVVSDETPRQNSEQTFPPDMETIHGLERLVEEAIAGRIRSIAAVTIDHDGDVRTAWSSKTGITMAGAISVLYHRYLAEVCGPDVNNGS